MRIAYLVNQYPKISHSFIRREILGIEAAGHEVFRYSIRDCDVELVDPADIDELGKTKMVLNAGILKLVSCWLMLFVSRPLSWLRCFILMIKVSRVSDRSFVKHLAYMLEASILYYWFAKADIEHVHAHFGTNPATVAMFCKVLGGPGYSFTVHGPEEFDKPIEISLADKIQWADFVVAISSFGRSQLYRWCDYQHWSKIHIVHCGVDNIFLQQDVSVPFSTEPNFVCVARLNEQKGHFILLEAAKQLAQQGKSFKVFLVGDGPLRSAIQAKIDQWDLSSYVEITGWASTSSVRERILQSRALVLPSFAEGLPVVIMESLALKRPVITTYVAGIPELVEPDVCGWLVPSGNADALTEAMTKALSVSVSELETMGTMGYERIVQQHDATVEAKRLANLFKATVAPVEEEVQGKQEPNTAQHGLTLSADVNSTP